MDIGSILLGLALLLIVAAFAARPLLERASAPAEAPGPAADLLAERENVLAALRDLDFDHATGKIEMDDYQAQRARLVSQGADVLRALDALGAGRDEPLDAEIEAAILARRRRGPAPAAAAVRACAACGAEARAEDRFCGRCGAALPAPAEAA